MLRAISDEDWPCGRFGQIKGESNMYGRVLGACTGTVCTAAALTLPNTGSNIVVTMAVSIATGMVVWGLLYARSRTVKAKAVKG